MISGVSSPVFSTPTSLRAGPVSDSAPPKRPPPPPPPPEEVSKATQSSTQSSLELTEEEKAQVAALKKTDQEVHTHEQAHKNAGGKYAGSASFGYVAGPDGKRYAVSGEVSIDIAPVTGDPEATIAKMNAVASAALAPAEPSGQDRRVAARAAALRSEAQAELNRQSREASSGEGGDNKSTVNAQTLSAITAYQANSGSNSGTSIGAEDGDKPSGNIIDLFS